MALISHQTQAPFLPHSLRFRVSSQKVNRGSATVQFIFKTKAFLPLKPHFNLRERSVALPKRKAFRVSSFKSNAQNEGPERRNPKISKQPVQISSMQQGTEDLFSESQDAQQHPLSYSCEVKNSTTARSLAIQELFGRWLIMLRTQTSSQSMSEENVDKNASQCATSECQPKITGTKAGRIIKSAIAYFIGLDAAISLPLLIFLPWYLTVQVVHGAEVAKELIPLWIFGPFIVALHVKVIQGLCSLYLFLFVQAGKLIKNLPRYSLLVYNYVTEGKLRADFWRCFVKPIVDIKNLDYRAYSKQKYKQLEAWGVEKYLDFVESIWPYYCRTIRFLKKANLI